MSRVRMKPPCFLIGVAAVCMLVACPGTVPAQGAGMGTASNYAVVVLTPGHSRTIYYALSDALFSNAAAFQATMIMTLGAGTLSVSVGNHSCIGAGAEMVYASTGMVGTVPVADYAYSSSPLSFTVPVGAGGMGMVLTGILFATGPAVFPVTMSMVLALN
jgi:hypothetical protein